MGDYKYNFLVFLLLFIAVCAIIFYYFKNNLAFKKTSEYTDNHGDVGEEINYENFENYEDYYSNEIVSEKSNENNYNDENEEIVPSEIAANDIEFEDENEDIFNKDFSRENKKTTPDINWTNALKLGRYEGDDYVNDELGIKIKLLPGWSLTDFNYSFRLNEGSGQVNNANFTLFSDDISKYYQTQIATNTRIFGNVIESSETIGNTTYKVLKCKYDGKDYFERTVYLTNTKMENINICIETNFYDTSAPFATKSYSLSDIFEKF